MYTTEPSVIPELSITPEQEDLVQEMLEGVKQESPKYWAPGMTDSFYIPVDDGEIRVFHWVPEKPVSKRPVVFIPGWGVVPSGYDDLFEVLYNRTECFYIETREKGSSRLNRKKASLDMHQKARDIGDALIQLDLKGERDFVLMAPCWGAAILLQGLLDGVITVPTIITVDPMHTLWFPKWFLKYVGPWIPDFVITMLKPLFRHALLGDMEEPVQKQRALDLLKEAIIWKWKRSAIQVMNFELFDMAQDIKEEVFVVNGTNDKVHNQQDYPEIARRMPNGRFLYLKTGEENRERLMGLVALEFSKVSHRDGIPPVLRQFEKQIDRTST